MSVESRKRMGLLLAALLAIGLLAFAAVHLVRWQREGRPVSQGDVAIRKITMAEAPTTVQEAASKLQTSRVAYAMPSGRYTYVIISTGPNGERLELAGAKRDPVLASMINVNTKSSSRGDRLIIAALDAQVADVRNIRVLVDGYPGMVPLLVNADSLPLTVLPDTGALAVVAPEYNVRVVGSSVEVSGFARFFGGRFNIQVFAAGKGRVLGEALEVRASAGAPDWGSFRVSVPVSVPQGVTEGVVLIYDNETGAKVSIPIRFGSK